MYSNVKLYTHFFINSSAKAIIQPVITLDIDFASVHVRPLMNRDSSMFNFAVWPLLIPTLLNASSGSLLTSVSVAMRSFFSSLY